MEFIKADLTDHLGPPLNISQNKIAPYAACMAMENRNSNQQYCLHIKRVNLKKNLKET